MDPDGDCSEYNEIEEPICQNCNGSGEGMHDGTKCSACKGSGVEGTGEGG